MIENRPLVSIITTSYKKLCYLYKTIDSVLMQKYENIEYIISDDGSPDFDIEEYCNYIDNRKSGNIIQYKILYDGINRGTVKNFNRALKTSKGKYIVFLDGDDAFYDAFVVSKIVDYMENNKSNILITKRIICDEELNQLYEVPNKKIEKKISKLKTAKQQFQRHMKDHIFGMASSASLAVKRSLFEENNYYDEKYRLLEDAPFFAKILYKGIKIDFDFSIISIFYRNGGVSTSPFSSTGIGKMYLDDCWNYMNNYKEKAFMCFGFWDRYLYNAYLNFFLQNKPTKWNHIKYELAILYYKIVGVM